jgi:hypothetical protein
MGGTNENTLGRRRRRHVYQPRGKPILEIERQQLTQQWGSWNSVLERPRPRRHHGKSSPPPLPLLLPNDDGNDNDGDDDFAYTQYPHRDVPYDNFPSTAWQRDKEYLTKFLTEGQVLVRRSMEAILAEYGHGSSVLRDTSSSSETKNFTSKANEEDDDEDAVVSFRERSSLFTTEKRKDTTNDTSASYTKNDDNNNHKGGWISESSWKGLQRRLLHAIMTEDSFVLAMAGHGVAAGVGYVPF